MKYVKTAFAASLLGIATSASATVIDFNDLTVDGLQIFVGGSFSSYSEDGFTVTLNAGGARAYEAWGLDDNEYVVGHRVNAGSFWRPSWENPVFTLTQNSTNAFNLESIDLFDFLGAVSFTSNTGATETFVASSLGTYFFDSSFNNIVSASWTSNSAFAFDNINVSAVSAVPEPSTYALMLGGLGMVGFMATRRRKQKA